MKKRHNTPQTNIRWTVLLILTMVFSSTYTLLDAFVIPKTYVVVAQEPLVEPTIDTTGESENTENTDLAALTPIVAAETNQEAAQPEETSPEVIITADSYSDENIQIQVETMDENGVVYYLADIRISDVSYLKTAFANDAFGKNITQTTSEMAAANNAIFAINGDYYGFRDTGLVIRNGVLYRDVFPQSAYDQSLVIDSEGSLAIVDSTETSGTTLIENSILQGFTFGPNLVLDGQICETNNTTVSQKANPRTAIGQISPLHYLFIVVDGRSDESNGMTLPQLAQVFIDHGAALAYNLDGGGSAAMWLNGNLINNPTDGRKDGERNISDIIYIGY